MPATFPKLNNPRVESLTDAQKAKQIEVRDKWISIGLSTEPTDKDAGEAAIAHMYATGGYTQAPRVHWCTSPLAAVLAISILRTIKPEDLKESVSANVSANVSDNVSDNVSANVSDNVNSTAEPEGYFKDYFIRVPPDTKTAKAAVAWTFGYEAKEYAPAVQT